MDWIIENIVPLGTGILVLLLIVKLVASRLKGVGRVLQDDLQWPLLAAGVIVSSIGLIFMRDFFLTPEARLSSSLLLGLFWGPVIAAVGIVLIAASMLAKANDRAALIQHGNRVARIGKAIIFVPLALGFVVDMVYGGHALIATTAAAPMGFFPGLALVGYAALVTLIVKRSN